MGNLRDLRHLARLYGVQPTYYDVSDRQCHAGEQALLKALQTLGAPVETARDAPGALRQRRRELAQRTVEPVVVAWDGRAEIPIRVPESDSNRPFACRIHLEEGGHQEWTGRLSELRQVKNRDVDGTRFDVRLLRLPFSLPSGYHRMTLDLPDGAWETLVISAPMQAYGLSHPSQEGGTDSAPGDSPGARGPGKGVGGQAGSTDRLWGAFLPLYALHSESSWGAGDFSDLEKLMEWVSERGGRLVATLPLLAAQWGLTHDPSPYSPTSRLFWNEFYIDVRRIPELAQSAEARELLEAEETRAEIRDLRRQSHVDYERQMALKGKVLVKLAEAFFGDRQHISAASSDRRAAFERFCRNHPEAESYARFRAVGERLGRFWPEWPERLQRGDIRPGDYDESVARYHQYVQWQAEEQLEALTDRARELDLVWYLDFPLGVNRTGFDVWQNRDLFALEMSGGAPPDLVFTKGQDWGFPPLHPQRLRERGYSYFIQALRRHLKYARLLRLDHVMSLHRLFWVPSGGDASEGVYVRYPADELFAVLSLESHRHEARIVGENLGTVPDVVDANLHKHHVLSTYVYQYELSALAAEPDEAAEAPRSDSVASLNTHDMPPFAGFWTGLDIDDRLDLGLLTEKQAHDEREARAQLRRRVVDFLRRGGLLQQETFDPYLIMQGCLAWMGAGDASVLLVNLEDLWEETRPQNTPGTVHERSNWRRKARYPLEKFSQTSSVLDLLRLVDQSRRSGRTDGSRVKERKP